MVKDYFKLSFYFKRSYPPNKPTTLFLPLKFHEERKLLLMEIAINLQDTVLLYLCKSCVISLFLRIFPVRFLIVEVSRKRNDDIHIFHLNTFLCHLILKTGAAQMLMFTNFAYCPGIQSTFYLNMHYVFFWKVLF